MARVKDNTAFVVQEERPLTAAAHAAGVVRDVVISRLGTAHHKDHLKRPMRLVIVRTVDRDGKTTELWLITDRLDLDAELVALAYRYRWTVELFFRWLKCVLGARHLIAHNRNGVTLQMYAALIVSLLIVLRTGRKPTKRTFETIQFHLLGWVSDEEFDAHLAALSAAKTKNDASPARASIARPRRLTLAAMRGARRIACIGRLPFRILSSKPGAAYKLAMQFAVPNTIEKVPRRGG